MLFVAKSEGKDMSISMGDSVVDGDTGTTEGV